MEKTEATADVFVVWGKNSFGLIRVVRLGVRLYELMISMEPYAKAHLADDGHRQAVTLSITSVGAIASRISPTMATAKR